MVWVKIDDGFFDHPKNRAVGKDGRELLFAALCHSNRYLTGGFIADHDLPLLAAKAEVRPNPTAKVLLEHGRWHRAGHDCSSCDECPPGHYLIHDYEEFQGEAVAVAQRRSELSAKRSEAGRKGARSRWQKDVDANSEAMASRRQTHSNGMTPVPVPVPYLESPSSSETHDPSEPPDDDDDLPDGLWAAVADRKLRDYAAAGGQIKSRPGMLAVTERNARTELADRARQLASTYVLTTGELVDVLCAPSTPTWLAMCKRRDAS